MAEMQQVLHKHDQAFAGRTVRDVVTVFDYHHHSLVFSQNGTRWRELRRICNMELFTPKRLDILAGVRQEKVQALLRHVHKACAAGHSVDIGLCAFGTTLNLVANTIFSKDVVDLESESAGGFKNLLWEILDLNAKPNLSDFFPALRWPILMSAASKYNSYKADVFIGGSDTTSTTIEWAMTELLRHPDKMSIAQLELKRTIGSERHVKESHIQHLPYLQSLVKETLRLHPPVPLLVPHSADVTTEVAGFTIRKNTQVLVNAWAIGPDPASWENATSFLPERFLNSDVNFKGKDFHFIPFGAGRRDCPAIPLGVRMVHLMLASLLHSFSWNLPHGMGPEQLDVKAKFGLTLQKAIPLKAFPSPWSFDGLE
ncbi:geraniol 8-hydroxylase [Nymphaea colorata]|uniref:geraniol 8-hydroxylase n=1 Tax=Nymphaea colorata TaxID=210225 RepID=UPI00129E6F7A|nr:geraniol 8-hydroxylase [Nymphaea colorata]